jgi:hypothetical protein
MQIFVSFSGQKGTKESSFFIFKIFSQALAYQKPSGQLSRVPAWEEEREGISAYPAIFRYDDMQYRENQYA